MMYAIDTFDKEGLFVFAFRNKIIGALSEKEKEIYLPQSKEDEERISLLKNKLSKNPIISHFEYNPKIENGVLDLREFSLSLISLIEQKILTTIKDDGEKNAIQKTIEEQNALIEINHNAFSGRENVFESLNKFYEGPSRFLAIAGESGTGKSSLIQEEIYRQKKNNKIVLYFLLGNGEGSKDIRYTLASLLFQAKELNGRKLSEKYLDINAVDNDYDSLVNELSMELTILSSRGRVYIYLDALDQLTDTGKGRLSFLNSRYFVSENIDIKVVVSYIPRKPIEDELKLKLFDTISIPPLSNDDVLSITKRRLSREKKSLSTACLNEILDKKENGLACASSPLYLSLLLQQIVNLDYIDFSLIEELKATKKDEDAIYSYIQKVIKEAPNSIKGEMFGIINSASKKISHEFVYRVLGVISMSRNGVREKDIEGIFRVLGIQYNSSDFSYLRKMFRHFISSASSYIDFNHKIIDDLLEEYYFIDNKEDSQFVSLKTVEYLDSLPTDDEFKKNEYFFYAYKANSWELFNKHLKETDYLYPFFELFEDEECDERPSDFFYQLTSIEDATIARLLDEIYHLNYLARQKLILLLLENKQISHLNRIRCLYNLSLDEFRFGNDKAADQLSKVMIDEAYKYNEYLTESLMLRGEILIKKYKYSSLKRLLKKVGAKANQETVFLLGEKCKEETKKNKATLNNAFFDSQYLIDFLSTSSPKEIYDNSESIEKGISQNIVNSDSFINSLLQTKEQYYSSSLNSGIKDVVSYSYTIYLIGITYLASGKKEEGKQALLEGYSILNSVYELLEEKKDFALISEYVHLLRRLKAKTAKEEIDKFAASRKHGVNNIRYNELKGRRFAYFTALIGVFVTLVVLDFVMNSIVYQVSSFTMVKADNFMNTYVEYSYEVLAFSTMFPFVYFLLTYLFNSHKHTNKAKMDMLSSLLFFGTMLLSTALFVIATKTQNRTNTNISNETIFFLRNSLIGAISITIIAFAIRNFVKEEPSMYDRIEKMTLRKRKIVEVTSLAILGMTSIVFAIIQFVDNLKKFIPKEKGDVMYKIAVVTTDIAVIAVFILPIIALLLYSLSLVLKRRRR